ncbi:MAG: methyltransferase domain-containing protein [Deltaproteobacteria bacterium]|nr:methyltransferase domain-containing protein [Deltaproteobacteria bacterium]
MDFLEKLRKTNNRVCPWWLCRSFDNPLRRLIHDPERMLSPFIRPGLTVVDIGCGMGYFTIGLARLVGPEGRVIAVDLQPQMLAALGRRADQAGLADRIVPRLARPDSLEVAARADFALAFWMAHEVPDKRRFFGEIFRFLKLGGSLLLCEPKFHVTGKAFAETAALCREAGFLPETEPSIALSRASLMRKDSAAA